MCTKKRKRTLALEYGELLCHRARDESYILILRYVVPSTVNIDHRLSSLGDHLKRYVESPDLPIIMYLHGQDGTR